MGLFYNPSENTPTLQEIFTGMKTAYEQTVGQSKFTSVNAGLMARAIS